MLCECSGGPGTVLGVVLPRGLLKQPRPFGLCARRANGRGTTMEDEPHWKWVTDWPIHARFGWEAIAHNTADWTGGCGGRLRAKRRQAG